MRLLERGVYRAPYLTTSGQVVLFAVDHAHRQIDNGVVYLHEEDDFLGPIAALWRMLDAQDPEYARRQSVRDQQPKAALRASIALLPICTTFSLLRLLVL